jgi:hypothetical protein
MGFNPFEKNLINSPKILLDLNFTKVNLVGITCMQEKELQSKCQTVWFEKNKNSLILKFKPYNISCTAQTHKDFIQAFKTRSELLFRHCSCYSDTRCVIALPPNRNLILRFGRSSGSNKNSEHMHHSSLGQDEVWMARTEEVLTFPRCFFFRVVAPLNLEEIDCFTPHDTILLIQDLDWVLGI